MAAVALRFKKKQALSCMRTKGKTLSDSYSTPFLSPLEARAV